MSKINIRQLTPADIPELIRLNDQVQQFHANQYPHKFKYPVDPDKIGKLFQRTLEDSSHSIIGASSEPRLLGYLWWEVRNRKGTPFAYGGKKYYIHHISVDANRRREGIAASLFNRMSETAKSEGIDEIGLDTWVLNGEAQSFFESQGFNSERIIYSKTVF